MKTQGEDPSESVRLDVLLARQAQEQWAFYPVSSRLRLVRELRRLVATRAPQLSEAIAVSQGRPVAEKMVSEVLPLADACLWLEKQAHQVLAPRRPGKTGRPFWLRDLSLEIQPKPYGLVLVIAPRNYPLFIPAVQTLQALVAGNAVLLKPAPGTEKVAAAFAETLIAAGFGSALLAVLPSEIEAGLAAIERGVDKVVFTGSSESGREVLKHLARGNTPAVMELSGEDLVLVLADADIGLVTRALRFGLEWNGGDTCIAPRKLLVAEAVAEALAARLAQAEIKSFRLETFRDDTAVVLAANNSSFGLGAAIFSRNLKRAKSLAARIRSGFVLINDLIVPTADPRMPFGGVKASGFGVTRGEEGLLAMTYPHAVVTRRSKVHRHFSELGTGMDRLFGAYLLAAHGRGESRLAALGVLAREAFAHLKKERTSK